jgi:quercetin dioxygenase-like cupin family protein
MGQDLIRRVLMKLDKNYLPYEYFENVETFKEIEVVDGITFTKYPTEKGIYFQSKLKADTKLVEHYHNSNEFCYIKSGRLILNDTIELVAGDSYSFEPFEPHNMQILEDCEMYVQLTKDEDFRKSK